MPNSLKWLKPDELKEIGMAHTHQNSREAVESYRKALAAKIIPEPMLRKHEADDNYNAPAAERTAKQTMILENRLFPNVPLGRYFIVPIWNTIAELLSGKRIKTNLIKILAASVAIAACVTAIFFFPPVITVFVASTFFSLSSLLTVAGIATVALYAGNTVASAVENRAHKDHWDPYECTRLQQQYFKTRYGIDKYTSQKIKAYLINKSEQGNDPIIKKMASNLLDKLRISDENALHGITVFFVEELKVLKRARPKRERADTEAPDDKIRRVNDTRWVSEIVNALDKAHNLNPETDAILKEYTGRRDVKKWMKRVDELIGELDALLKAAHPNDTAIQSCNRDLTKELDKVRIEELVERPKHPSINLLFNKYNKVTLILKDYVKLDKKMMKLGKIVEVERPPPELAKKLSEIDEILEKRLGNKRLGKK